MDDSDVDPIIKEELEKYSFYIDFISIKRQNKNWINPCVNYNIGFEFIKGSKVIIQNSEVCHIGDVLIFIDNNLKQNEYLVFDGSSYITASTPYWRSEAFCPTIFTSVASEYQITSASYVATYTGVTYGSGSYGTSSYATVSYKFSGSIAQVQNYLPAGINNQKYNGSKLTSADFNINSTQTVDGGPAVEWKTANPNQLIYQTLGEQGSFVLV